MMCKSLLERGPLLVFVFVASAGLATAARRVPMNWSFIAKSGKRLSEAQRRRLDKKLTRPLSPAQVSTFDCRWGFKNAKGRFVIKPRFGSVQPFAEGLAAVEVVSRWEKHARGTSCARVSATSRYGYVDRRGKLVIPAVYNGAGLFRGGLAMVFVGRKAGFIDRQGKLAIPLRYKEARGFHGGLAAVSVADKGWGFVDSRGKTVIAPRFASAGDFHQGLAAVRVGQLWGYVDKTGAMRIKPRFAYAHRFSEGRAAVNTDTKTQSTWGYIDKSGKLVIQATYGYAKTFSHGLAAVRKNLRWGYIDTSGKLVIAHRYHRAGDFNSLGYARVGKRP